MYSLLGVVVILDSWEVHVLHPHNIGTAYFVYVADAPHGKDGKEVSICIGSHAGRVTDVLAGGCKMVVSNMHAVRCWEMWIDC